MSYSSKLLLDGQYGIYINDELVVTTTSRHRLQNLMKGLREKAEQSQKLLEPEEVA